MTDNKQTAGSIVALVTPMHADGAIDWECLQRLVDWHVESGTDGIVAVGTTGETPTLDMDEHAKVIAKTVEYADGRLSVIAGTGANSTAEAIRLTEEACKDGADACLSVVPYYNKPTQDGLRAHFLAVADVASKPIILYNVPSRTITDLADETLADLAKHPRIVGVKDATGDMQRLAWQMKNIGEDFTYLSGDDGTSMEYVLNGGQGVISVTANIAPAMMHDMIAAARAGDTERAKELDETLSAFNIAQGVVSNPIPVKWALHDSERIGSGIRLPLTPLPAEHHEQIRTAIKNLK